MTANTHRFLKPSVCALTMLAALMTASCGPQYSAPQQTQSSNPSVTYKYHNDQELVQVNQSAAAYCSRYQAVPRTANFTNDPDGSKAVVFECIQTPPQVVYPQTSQVVYPQPQYNSNILTYNYRTDQELLDASRNAQTYCRNSGSQQVISNIVTNSDGSKTITFRCSS